MKYLSDFIKSLKGRNIVKAAVDLPEPYSGMSDVEIAMPQEATMGGVKYSGNMTFDVMLRNMPGEYSSFGLASTIRHLAYEASCEGRPIRVLELSEGLPFNAIAFQKGGRAHKAGDMMRTGIKRFKTPETVSTIVSKGDYLAKFMSNQFQFSQYELFNYMYLFDEAFGDLHLTMDGAYDSLGLAYKRYEMKKESGDIRMFAGEPVGTLYQLVKDGERFDLIFSNYVAWTANRMNHIRTVQAALDGDGIAYIPLTWWSPPGPNDKGKVEITLLADMVKVNGKDAISLEEYLSNEFPDAFSIANFPGAKTLVAKGTDEPAEIPVMKPSVYDQQKVHNGFPELHWTSET